jgi:hypothetical protein
MMPIKPKNVRRSERAHHHLNAKIEVFAPKRANKLAEFKACLVIGTAKGRVRTNKFSDKVCAEGKNPREAIAAAMHQGAKQIAGRVGAFHGLK